MISLFIKYLFYIHFLLYSISSPNISSIYPIFSIETYNSSQLPLSTSTIINTTKSKCFSKSISNSVINYFFREKKAHKKVN